MAAAKWTTVAPGVRERRIARDNWVERKSAGIATSMKNAYGFVFKGPTRTVYLSRCDASREWCAGWWVQSGDNQALARSEKQGRKLAIKWAETGVIS